MVMRLCPHCKESYSCNEYDTDYIHVCNSEKEQLDNDDYLIIDKPNMNLQGMANTSPLIAKVQHEHQHMVNVFGHDINSYEERQHEEYITF